jgi:hypothetical protein
VVTSKYVRVRLGSGQSAEPVNQRALKPGEREKRGRKQPSARFPCSVSHYRRDAGENQSRKVLKRKGTSTGRERQQLGRGEQAGMELAPRVGFEPTTLRLTAECSTVELPRSGFIHYSIHPHGLSNLTAHDVPPGSTPGYPLRPQAASIHWRHGEPPSTPALRAETGA